MKQYIIPITEIMAANPVTLLDSSVLEGSQIKDDFMSKKNDFFFDDAQELDEDAWEKGFSVWEE